MGPNGLVEVARFESADGLYDCCWSEENENILVSASGDGSVKVWDVAAPPQMNPLRSFEVERCRLTLSSPSRKRLEQSA